MTWATAPEASRSGGGLDGLSGLGTSADEYWRANSGSKIQGVDAHRRPEIELV